MKKQLFKYSFNEYKIIFTFFILISSSIIAQIDQKNRFIGDNFDSNIRNEIPSGTDEAILLDRNFKPDFVTNTEVIEWYNMLKVKGDVKFLKQKGYDVIDGDIGYYSSFNLYNDDLFRNYNLLEAYNFEAHFENKKPLNIKIYTPQNNEEMGELVFNQINSYQGGKLVSLKLSTKIVLGSFAPKTCVANIESEFKYDLNNRISQKTSHENTDCKDDNYATKRILNYKYGFKNSLNAIVESSTINSENHDSTIGKYIYNSKGTLSEFIGKDFRCKFEYANSKLVKISNGSNNFALEYDKKGRLFKKSYTDYSGCYKSLIYNYSDKGILSQIEYKNSYLGSSFSIAYKYNNKEDKVSEQKTTSASSIHKPYQITFEYKYDEKGNWTERKDFVNGKLRTIFTRDIQYY